MPRELTDFTKSALTKQFQAKGNIGSQLLEELQPVVLVHDLEGGPNKPYARFTVEGSLAAVVGQSCIVSMHIVNPIPPIAVEQTVILDSMWADQPWHAGLGADLVAFDTPIGVRTCRDHDLRRAKFDGGLSQWMPGFLDDIVVLHGNNTADKVLQPMLRGIPNIITPLSLTFPRRLYNESPIPALIFQADATNTTMKWCFSGRLFSVAS